jgi:predicted metal-dependent RNase
MAQVAQVTDALKKFLKARGMTYAARCSRISSSSVRFACLGSGSEGNGLLIEAGATRVLIDCGFGIRDTVACELSRAIEQFWP